MVNFNGQLTHGFIPPPRSARYGDGFFEAIRIFNGKAPFFEYHWERIYRASLILKINLPEKSSPAFFESEISKLTGGKGEHRVRLTIWRDGGGLYTPEKNDSVFLIESSPILEPQFVLNQNGLSLGIYRENKLPLAKGASSRKYFLPNIKTCSALPFVLANVFRKESGFDDVLLLNSAGRIACGGSSNVFLWMNNKLITPPLSEGCVAGTMRNALIDICEKINIEGLEKPVFKNDLKMATGVFLTNAISGIKWVGNIYGIKKEYVPEGIEKIMDELNFIGVDAR